MWRHELEEAREHDPVVIVPVGSIEQHGPHCPLDVDISVPYALAMRVAERVDDFPVLVAPPVWWGLSHYNQGFIGTITLQLETQVQLLADVCRSIHASGFKRIILLNGHGGNQAPIIAIATKMSEENIFAVAITYWDLAPEELRGIAEEDISIGHGGELETSLMLHLRPQLVDGERIADEPMGSRPRLFGPERRQETPTGVSGMASLATADKGERLFHAVASKLEALVRQYHAAPVKDYWHRER
jgi:creatinine amidohydrolase